MSSIYIELLSAFVAHWVSQFVALAALGAAVYLIVITR